MFEIKGKVNTAICYAKVVEDEAIEQVRRMCDYDLTDLRCYRSLQDSKRLERSLGTLGGGNHFIEIDKGKDGTYYLIIHSGSRNLGKQVAEIYQQIAIDLHMGKEKYFKASDDELPWKRR